MNSLLLNNSEMTKIKILQYLDENLQLINECFCYVLKIKSNILKYGNNDSLVKAFFKIPRSLTNGTFSIHGLSNRELWKSNIIAGFRYTNALLDDNQRGSELEHVFILFSNKNKLDILIRKELEYRLHKIYQTANIHLECIGKWTNEKIDLIDLKSTIDLKSEIFSRLRPANGSMIIKQINQQPIYFGELNQKKTYEKKNKHSDN